jgi:cobalt-precorrin-5B (C1)-methyltransferase
MERYIEKDGKALRFGYTTGSCAAAAAKAAACMLLTDKTVDHVILDTPKGFRLELEILEIHREAAGRSEGYGGHGAGMAGDTAVTCAVRKDAGDDPDVTDGALVFARVEKSAVPGIRIDGGEGVGRVTKPGLDQPVGAAAINSVPRRMIEKELQDTAAQQGYTGGFNVLISIPDGERLAEKTFNPKLGITGGISVLGTSGIVEPMSEDAILDTIRVEVNMRRASDWTVLPMAPGNYGRDFMKKAYGFELDRAVECSNYVGDAIDMAVQAGFRKLLFVGHLGKLIKVAGGVMNTHSKYGDRRMEILSGIAAEHGAGSALRERILACVATDDAVRILKEEGLAEAVLADAAERAAANCDARARGSGGSMHTEVITFSNVYGELGRTAGAEQYIREALQNP